MAKFNLDNPEVMRYILGSAKKWLDLGFDGLRIDHAIGFSMKSLKCMIREIKQEYPKTVAIGELKFSDVTMKDLRTIKAPGKFWIWLLNVKRPLYREYGGILDGFLDLQTMERFGKYAHAHHNKILVKKIKGLLSNFKNIKPITLLDSHDDERFLFKCGGDTEKLKKAVSLQMSLPTPTIIYYGTEIGMTQKEPFSARKEHADLFARQPMIWKKSEQNLDLLNFYKQAISSRHSDLKR